jgi:hypothetical protein
LLIINGVVNSDSFFFITLLSLSQLNVKKASSNIFLAKKANTIHNESAFRSWLHNNPGKIWIIGNEVDIASQDDLSESEYARMFKKYYDVIGEEDPSARYAVAAPGGLKNNEDWGSQKNFFEGFIDSYKNQFGSAPPVDIWNTHVYGRSSGDVNWCVGLIDGFINWVRTTEGGIYFDSEIIITEFGLFGDHSDSTMINFMNDICEEFETRVDQGRLDRFFWFIGAWCPSSDCGHWEAGSLFGPDGNPTPLGQAYAQRANNWSGTIGISYTLTTTVSGSGSVNPSGGTYDEDSQVQLTATATSGWNFSHWSGDLSGSANPAAITMSSNRTVSAVFTYIGGGGEDSFELNPMADDFYSGGSGDDNHIKTQSNKTGFLKFDLNAVTGSVVSATLTCITSQDKPGTTHSFGSEDDSWVEGGLSGNLSLGPQLDSATNSGKNQEVVWDVTSFITTQVPAAGGDGIATLALKGPNQVYFYSREYRPNYTVLTIETTGSTN